MKKIAFILASLLLMGAAASCGKSDPNNGGSPGGSKNICTKVEVKLTANFNADYFRYADYKVKYTEGGTTKTENLTAPAANSRSNWTKTLTFTSEADVVFEVECTPKKDVEYETRTKIVGKNTFEYVVFNTNAFVDFQIKGYDASGKQIGDSYGTTLENIVNRIEGQVVETHGAGADENPNAFAVKINGAEVNNFQDRNLKSYKCHYKIVKGADGLTAESAE